MVGFPGNDSQTVSNTRATVLDPKRTIGRSKSVSASFMSKSFWSVEFFNTFRFAITRQEG